MYKQMQPRRAFVNGRASWVFPNGKVIPVVSGGDSTATPTALTVQDLVDARARKLNEIDAILDTAREAKRSLTAEEQAQHDALVAEVEGPAGFDELIRTATAADETSNRLAAQEARRSATFDVPNIAVRGGQSVGAEVTRNLDALLWATDETVPAGTYDKAGTFHQHASARNTVEQVVIRNADGQAEAAPRIGDFLPQNRQAVRRFQRLVADMAVFGLMIDKSAKSSADGFEAARSHRAFSDRWNDALRALDVDTAGEGGQWVPTGIGASLHERVRAEGRVAALFSRIDLPTNPWRWPIEGADTIAYRVAEPTGNTETKVAASTPGTVAATFDAEIMGGRTLFSRSIEADSALAILPYTQLKLVRAFVTAEERAILDGDADGTHQDADVQALGATDARTAWDGLRKRALANASVATTTSTSANLAIIRALMGKWGLNPADLAFIVGVSAYHDLLVDPNFITIDKMGAQATILNGQLGAAYGIPVIVSENVRENLNASGVHDGITQTRTYNLCVNRGEWVMGQRMALDVEVDDSIYRETFQRVVVGFMREDFQNVGDAAGNDDTAIGFNVTP